MDKRKLGTILATIAGVGLFTSFTLFTVGGFLSVRYMDTSPLLIIGATTFLICIFISIAGAILRHHGDITTVIDYTKAMFDSASQLSQKNQSTNTNIQCSYCGTVYESSKSSCPNCGSVNTKE